MVILILFSFFFFHNLFCIKEVLWKADNAYLAGDYQKSIDGYKVALEKNPSDNVVLYNLGTAAFKNKDYELSKTSFKKLIESELSKKSLVGYGDSLLKTKDYDSAIENYEKALDLCVLPKDEAEKTAILKRIEIAKKLKEEQQQQQQDKKEDQEQNQDKDNQEDKQEKKQDQKDQDQNRDKDNNKEQDQSQSSNSKDSVNNDLKEKNVSEQEIKILDYLDKQDAKAAKDKLEKALVNLNKRENKNKNGYKNW